MVQWLNIYGHILDSRVVDESQLPRVQFDLPKHIGGGHEGDYQERAVGVAWFKNNKYVDTYWRRGKRE